MIGRETDIREVSQTLAAGGHLVIAGPRRTGKTSVCDAALGRLARRGFYTVAIDLFRIPNAAQLAEVLVAKTVSNRSVLRRALHGARQAGRAMADAATTSAVLRSKTELGDELEIAFMPGIAARDPDRYLDYALSLPGRIGAADRKQVVVFFDEFQEMAGPQRPYGDPDRLTKRMRAVFQRSTEVSLLFAGSVEHLMRDLFTPAHRALHQFGSFHELRSINTDAWIEGLRTRFLSDDCHVQPGALERIAEYGELHPRATMLLAQRTHLASVQLETRAIDLALAEQGLLAAMEGDRLVHEQAVERIRGLHRLGLEVGRRIAAGEPAYRQLPRGGVRRALEVLRDAAFIESESRASWHVTDPLLARYLRALDPMG
jgi:uncharacterized protein